MKYLSLIFSILLFSTLQVMADPTHVITETFKVYGNCGMCKRTIESTATGVNGVQSANWDVETGTLTVSFNHSIVSLDNIKKAIADSGYDSDTHRANTEAYKKLAGCCQYDRPKP